MAARVTKHVIEAIVPLIARSPTTPTGAGVTQHLIEAVVANPGPVRITQIVMEAIVSSNPDGSHGTSGTASPATRAYGHAT